MLSNPVLNPVFVLFDLILYLSKPSDNFQIPHTCEQMLMLASFRVSTEYDQEIPQSQNAEK